MKLQRHRGSFAWTTPAAALIVMSASAHAQTAETSAAAPSALAEVVVTARRREEQIQSVPVSVTALTGDQLIQRGVEKLEDIRFQAPALQVQPSPYGPAIPAYQVRGQRQQESLITQDPSVGLYVDEVYQARAHGTNQSLFDLENVQVLRGPQGTLFGRNTSGGAVLLQSKRPTNDFGGEVDMTAGNYNLVGGTGVVNIPVGEILSLRGAVNYSSRDGYVKNANNGQNIGDETSSAWRFGALFSLGDLQSYFVFSGQRYSSNGFAWILSNFSDSFINHTPAIDPAAAQAALARQRNSGFYTAYSDLSPDLQNVYTHNYTNITTYNISSSLTIKNVLGYRDIKADAGENFDGTDLKTLSGLATFNAYTRQREHQFSEEFQVQGDVANERVKYIAGLYYFEEKGSDHQQTVIGSFGISEDQGGNTAKNTSQSVFAQTDIKIIDPLTLTLGARYSHDERSLTARTYLSGLEGVPGAPLPALYPNWQIPQLVCLIAGSAPDCTFSPPKYKHSEPTWTAGLNYQITDDKMIYVTVSRGYRSGGLNLRGSTLSSFGPFKPELVTNYEGGFKADWRLGSMPLRTNLSVYYQDYKNIQRTVFAQFPGAITATAAVLNAAAAKISGGEFEMTVLPIPSLEFTGFLNYTHAKYDSFTFDIAAHPDGSGVITLDNSANDFAGTPSTVYGITGRYTLPIAKELGDIAFQAQFYHQSRMTWTDTLEPGAETPGYGLLDLRLEWNNIDGHNVDVSVWGKNVLAKEYAAYGTSTLLTVGYQSYLPGAPRTVGVDVRAHF